jgi:adenylate cyclase class 1
MKSITFQKNKKTYLAYNTFRKNIFSQLSPKESETILYLLPWLITVNHPSVPGYVQEMKQPFMVHDIANEKNILKREDVFKNMFKIKKEGTFLRFPADANLVHGIYTIGSAGTISQTSRSDCDIWVCIDRQSIDENALEQFNQKMNLIKDWCDAHLKMSVFFFVSDLQDIKSGNYGNISEESSGSAQKNILKEEFYRTSILICGKIPLWWVCHDEGKPVNYNQVLDEYNRDVYGDYDFVDLGNIEAVDKEEYLGSALWQFNKALNHPLKSIIKMLLLEMLLASPREEMLCHQFRHFILSQSDMANFTDPSMFTMETILRYNENIDTPTFEFIKKCFYLRYEIKLRSKKITLKETLTRELFQKYPIEKEDLRRLNDFSVWSLHDRTEFGDRALLLLLRIYKRISSLQHGVVQGIAPQDLTIMGRKLSSCLEKKTGKIPVMQKPIESSSYPTLTFRYEKAIWQVHLHKDPLKFLVESSSIVYCIAYLVWNDIFLPENVRMSPNPTAVNIQEIINLAKVIKELFGIYNITAIDFGNFLKPEKTTKILVIVSFESARNENDIRDFCILHQNNWGELFEERIDAAAHLKDYFALHREKFAHAELNYYIRRSNQYYEKNIERTKRTVGRLMPGN